MLTNWKTLLVFTFATLAFTTNPVVCREHGNPLSALDSSLEGLDEVLDKTLAGLKRGHDKQQQQHHSSRGGGGNGNPLGEVQKTLNSDLKFLENSLQSLMKSLKKRDNIDNDQFEERDLADSLAKLLDTNTLYGDLTNHAQKRSPVFFNVDPSVFGDTKQAPAVDASHLINKREPLGGGGGSGNPLAAIEGLLSELTSALKKREPEPLGGGGGGGNPLAAIEGLLSELTSALKKREPEPLGGGGGGSGNPLAAIEGLLSELTSALKKREPEPLGGGGGGGSPLDAITGLLNELTSALKKRDDSSSTNGNSNNDYDSEQDQQDQQDNDNDQYDSKQEQQQPSEAESKQDQDSFEVEKDFKKEEEEMKMKFDENQGNNVNQNDEQKSNFGTRMIKRMVREI